MLWKPDIEGLWLVMWTLTSNVDWSCAPCADQSCGLPVALLAVTYFIFHILHTLHSTPFPCLTTCQPEAWFSPAWDRYKYWRALKDQHLDLCVSLSLFVCTLCACQMLVKTRIYRREKILLALKLHLKQKYSHQTDDILIWWQVTFPEIMQTNLNFLELQED